MMYASLIIKSKEWFEKKPVYLKRPLSFSIFSRGGTWMINQLFELEGSKTAKYSVRNFSFYGLLKYALCILFSVVCGFIFLKVNTWLMPLAIIVFYFIEVHFLFLFPLLIDGIKNPLRESIRQTYRLGLIKCLVTVFCIGCFMLSGLLNLRSPFHKWHIGSIAILIWYRDEVRDWIY